MLISDFSTFSSFLLNSFDFYIFDLFVFTFSLSAFSYFFSTFSFSTFSFSAFNTKPEESFTMCQPVRRKCLTCNTKRTRIERCQETDRILCAGRYFRIKRIEVEACNECNGVLEHLHPVDMHDQYYPSDDLCSICLEDDEVGNFVSLLFLFFRFH